MSGREIVAKNLRRLMAQHATLNTQAAVAQAAGIAQTAVGYLLRPDCDAMQSPKLDTIEHVASAFGLQAWEILVESGDYAPAPKDAGYIYVIRVGNLYKIGRAKNPSRRIGGMTLPVEPEIICTLHAEDSRAKERELHVRFSDYRKHGEWFLLPADAVADLKAAA